MLKFELHEFEGCYHVRKLKEFVSFWPYRLCKINIKLCSGLER